MIRPVNIVEGVQLGTSGTVLYTAPVNSKVRIDALSFTNTDSIPITITANICKEGTVADDTNKVLNGYSLAPGATYVPQGAIGQWISAEGFLQADASVAAKIACVASGVEYTGN